VDNTVNYIPQVDYTSRDYSSIRQDLLALISQYTPAWTSRDPSDLGMTLVEMFSYMGDLLNFYIDRAANEGFLATASQRDSVLQLAAMLGYIPDMPAAAITALTFTNASDTDVTIPAGTQVATSAVVNGVSTQIIFETDEEVVVSATDTADIGATQGYTVANEEAAISNGTPNQLVKLFNPGVISGSIQVVVNGATYNYVSSMLDYGTTDYVFSTILDSYGNTYVVFGDGINGKVPTNTATIYITYRVGLGSGGNVTAGTLRSIISDSFAGITVTNLEAAVGGADSETTDTIRLNAPRALRTLTRAVSLKDYAYLALQVQDVSKAVADASTYSSVIIYMSVNGGNDLTEGSPSAFFTATAAKVASYFTDKVAPNTSLTILPPTYVPVDINMTVYVLPQYQQSVVLSQTNASLAEVFATENSFFADVIPVQYVMNAVAGVPGVDYVTVELLRKHSSQQSYSINNYSRTGYAVTVTTTATHNVTVGQQVKVSAGLSATDGTWVVSAVTSNTITYVTTTTGTIGSTAISPVGSLQVQAVEVITCAVNEIPSLGTLTQTGVGGIN
jgi:hypothetical protein